MLTWWIDWEINGRLIYEYNWLSINQHVQSILYLCICWETLAKQIEIDKKIKYEWKISDEMLNEFKMSEPGKIFMSNSFGIDGNWCLCILPNGRDKDDKGYVCLGLNLLR